MLGGGGGSIGRGVKGPVGGSGRQSPPMENDSGPGQSPGWGFWGAKPPDGKQFSVFEMPLEGSPL